MGCDIHIYLEAKDDNGKWQFIAHEDVTYGDRNYSLFAALANVRNNWDIKPISEPRGFPSDMTDLMKYYSEQDYDGHSASWLLVSEIQDYEWDYQMGDNGSLKNWCCDFLKWIQFEDVRLGWNEPSKVRLVFWFDN